jgi:DNA-binding transcriptional LysR family regulator
MEMSQLEFLLKVVEEGSFSKAAQRVYRTQPAISIAIRRLEEEVGAALFDRTQKTPTLTEAGQIVYDYAQRIIALRDQARASVENLKKLEQGCVRIGSNESTSLYLLPEIILAFRERHPKVKVEIFRHVSDRLPREILDRKVDFALMAHEPSEKELEAFPVLKDELILIMSPKHPLSKQECVTVKELGKESFLAHNVQTASRKKVVETFAKSNTPLNITLELDTVETIKRFVRKNLGLALVPRMCVNEEIERGALATIPVKGLNYSRTLWAVHRRGAAFSPAVAAFLKLLKSYAKSRKD